MQWQEQEEDRPTPSWDVPSVCDCGGGEEDAMQTEIQDAGRSAFADLS